MATDFKAALEKGLRAHEDVKRVEREINEVLAELSRQLTEAVGSKVSVTRGWAHFDGEEEEAPALIAQGAKLSGPLCEFELARSGYPVNVAFEDQQYDCYDKASLETALARMLEDPVVAGRIKKLAVAAAL